ncbi:MAG TPA: hypothetical protein DG761_06405 [Gammaproteobacteria bacterium]|nr:hypothetical protein [Acidiferrobacteraceae bacterium]HCX87638.1 hypothetical protein [Gammaproteobacteria bacterium]
MLGYALEGFSGLICLDQQKAQLVRRHIFSGVFRSPFNARERNKWSPMVNWVPSHDKLKNFNYCMI